MIFRIQLTLKKETKGTFVYESLADEAEITVLYIKKHAFAEPAPNKISVIVEKVDG